MFIEPKLLLNELENHDHVYIYGAGMVGKFVFDYIKRNGKNGVVTAFIVTGGV